ncbi:MAG TPA: aminoacyl-tRNA synthetase [Noviherbaspirillum sp.]|uniref:aminoacyl-tRNA synthetase n=1 Tax=Noviherbaspirillum sp. TaxID=1926288 RepID=UPI002D44575F|nr:aminoacyl-tRNA synthetase [Noviherbaspirillum sp.]HYD95559.1 aminoacyl-tRNA synthetase [Noviherbaspirillum sp.]
MSDEEYFRSCVAKERHIAQLLGHEVEEYADSAGTLWINREKVPQWTRDWQACGALMTAFAVPVSFHREEGEACWSCVHAGPVSVRASDHPNRERALMAAVAKAVIHFLEHDKAHRHLAHPERLPGMRRSA